MAARTFHIASPDQLREMESLVTEGKLTAVISVWTATLRKEPDTRWNRAFFLWFNGENPRIAAVIRIDKCGEKHFCAKLRYNLALKYGIEHLKEVKKGA